MEQIVPAILIIFFMVSIVGFVVILSIKKANRAKCDKKAREKASDIVRRQSAMSKVASMPPKHRPVRRSRRAPVDCDDDDFDLVTAAIVADAISDSSSSYDSGSSSSYDSGSSYSSGGSDFGGGGDCGGCD